jgi:glycosyltransferase involved in cell wall biosynthesis
LLSVAVLLPVHNGEATVQSSIQSLAGQTYSGWTLVAVDDASSDATPYLLREFAAGDPRVQVLCNRERLGLAGSLNAAAAATSAQILARLDADDIALPTRLEEQLSFLESHPEVGVLGTGAELIDARGRSLGCAFRPEDHEILTQRIFRENPFIHPSVMLRRTFLEATGGYDVRLRRAQDYDLWLRGYKITRFHNLPRPLIRYRLRERPTWEGIAFGVFVLLRAALREGRPLSLGLYGLRFLVASTGTRLGLWSSRLR